MIIFTSMSSIPLGTPGWIYAMSCGAMPGLIKLGVTTLTPAARARQLSAATASPAPFVVLYSKHVSDCNAAEAVIHGRFAAERINDKREFFNVSFERAAALMDEIAKEFPFNRSQNERSAKESVTTMRFPWAELFATFPDDGTDRELNDKERQAVRELSHRLASSI